MSIRPIPVAAMGLSFTAGCTNASLAGAWQISQWVNGDGTDVTENYLYQYTYEDCTYTFATRMILSNRANGFLFTYAGADCGGDDYDYSAGYGLYGSGVQTGLATWEFDFGYTDFSCTLGLALVCEISDGVYSDAGATLTFHRL